jgi:pimeloyl-ACP methyl ester carboxylesterase
MTCGAPLVLVIAVPAKEAEIMNVPRADDWRSRGGHFSWRPAGEDASSVEIFHVEIGDSDAPVLLLIHGWPTSSIDWFEVAGRLSSSFRVCALDFPGYGFSGKPQGWGYSLTRDEELIEFYLSEVIGADAGVVVAHDRGDSVALLHAARCAAGRSAMRLEHLALSNGNIFLPLRRGQIRRTVGAPDRGRADSCAAGRRSGRQFVQPAAQSW